MSRGGYDRRGDSNWQPDERKIEEVIKGNAKVLADYASKLGERWSRNITTSQIRHFLSHIQNIGKRKDLDERRIINELHLLRAKLAYAAGRHGAGVKEFFQVVELGIKKVENKEDYKNLKNFVEAIVGYHKYYGGKEV